MSEMDFRLDAFNRQEFWNPHYNTADGKQKVDYRQMYYHCNLPGETPPDYDAEAIGYSYLAGLTTEGNVWDVGCSYPNFLETFLLLGHKKYKLNGVEPNYKQFNGLPFYRPITAADKVSELSQAVYPASNELYIHDWGEGRNIEGINLYQAHAGKLPIEEGTADAIYAMWVLYQLLDDEQVPALEHMSGKLTDDGLFVTTLSNQDNKPELIKLTSRIALMIGDVIGQEISEPPSFQQGFTAEKASIALKGIYEHVYQKRYKQKLIVNDTLSLMFAFNAVNSLADKFVDSHGVSLPNSIVKDYIEAYFYKILWPQIQQGKPFYDRTDRSMFICSQMPLKDLPLGSNHFFEV